MKQPTEPNNEDCCNSGCTPCIFDVYEKQLKLYQKFLESGETSSEPVENAISQLDYTHFLVVQNLDLCESYKLLKFKKIHEDNLKVRWKPGDHFLIKFISKDISCTRAYTPLKWKLCNEEYDFIIIVKIYGDGLMSNYLKGLNQGDHTLWRGPYGSYEICTNKFDRIIMIAQGTGIVAFIEIIDNILNNDDEMTRIVLYYCCQSKDKILLREELYSYNAYWNFTYKIFLSSAIDGSNYKYQEPIVHYKLGPRDIKCLKPVSIRDQFLICGSSEFKNEYEIVLKTEDDTLQNIIKF